MELTTPSSSEKTPVLHLEVNLGNTQKEHLVIFEGEEPSIAVNQFVKKHGLSGEKAVKLLAVAQEQLAAVLPRIIEENGEGGAMDSASHEKE